MIKTLFLNIFLYNSEFYFYWKGRWIKQLDIKFLVFIIMVNDIYISCYIQISISHGDVKLFVIVSRSVAITMQTLNINGQS